MHTHTHKYIYAHTHWLIFTFLYAIFNVVVAYKWENQIKSWIKMQRKSDHTRQSFGERGRIRDKTEILLWDVAQCAYKCARKEQEKRWGVMRETSTVRQSCRRLWRTEQEVQIYYGKGEGQPESRKEDVIWKSNFILSVIWITSTETPRVLYPLHHHLNNLQKQRVYRSITEISICWWIISASFLHPSPTSWFWN